MLRLLCGIEYEIRGVENIPKQPFIVASKHQSPFETFIFILLFRNAVFVLKRELKWIPFVGLHLVVLGMIFINRLDGISSIRHIVKLAKVRVKENRSIIIFPEGTRTLAKQKVKYQSGVAALYSILSVPVLPVALNTGLFWPKSILSVKKNPGKAIIEILPSIYPGLSRGEFLKKLEKNIEEKSSELAEGKLVLQISGKFL
ncbi:lysophospholipid acyltransferase family protein [Wolbachia endosymbiont of Dirofilaria (Dirofilaria) immitis]|uniref:lysophospholipid acyltransferase family protein n=1 Tax=Wolbachia endosymbiont of Dirofilaria (Dirofilaria) immitis TaxID=1812115 RepID=UPI00158CFA0F|nr:lysophospholipid acyltransferase family protein [Wolbachia endosymbiont of Dirofilaria (Dirofilaria) immitis]QKX02345.1 1-acyl-sn-glycerol-3-phosphate acyltransferase [Wolbachia endosymbiont of Dirofilaria (Dirofilaria) immitis]